MRRINKQDVIFVELFESRDLDILHDTSDLSAASRKLEAGGWVDGCELTISIDAQRVPSEPGRIPSTDLDNPLRFVETNHAIVQFRIDGLEESVIDSRPRPPNLRLIL